ncbi:hypothetical protein R1sor_026262 [Riccia sorocarpa]|uniref:AAA+ ATPase domain-containing protein n=1 Tax=Riccia sorocarpa TaxID=122646 RepID=A0ABD3GEX9_9MARC
MAISEVNAALEIVMKVKTVVDQIRASWSEESLAGQSLTEKLRRLEEQQRRWEEHLKKYKLPENHTVKRNLGELRKRLAEMEKQVSAVQQSNCCLRLWRTPSARELVATLDEINDMFNRLDDDLQNGREHLVASEADRHKPSISFSHDPKYVPVKETLESVKDALENDGSDNVVLLWGGSGEGKTTLAKYLAVQYDERFRNVPPCSSSAIPQEFKTFTGGLVYIFCGQNADSLTKMQMLWAGLRFNLGTSQGQGNETDEPVQGGGDSKAKLEEYKKRLMVRVGEENTVLVILDDVWDLSFLEDLVVSSVHIRYLVTSQKRDIWPDAISVRIGSPDLEEARKILANHIRGWKGAEFPAEVKDLVDSLLMKVQNHPLIIANLGTWIRWEKVPDRGTWLYMDQAIADHLARNRLTRLTAFREAYEVNLLASLTCEYALTQISDKACKLFYMHVMCTGDGVPESVLKLWFKTLLGPKCNMLLFDDSFSDLEGQSLISVVRLSWEEYQDKIHIFSSVHDLRRELLSKMKAEVVDGILDKLISSEGDCASSDDRREKDLVIALCFLFGDTKCREKAHSKLMHLMNADRSDLHDRVEEIGLFTLLLQSTFEEGWKENIHKHARDIILWYLGSGKLKDDAIAGLLETPEAFITTCSILEDLPWPRLFGFLPLTVKILLKTCDTWSQRGPNSTKSDVLDMNFYACVQALHNLLRNRDGNFRWQADFPLAVWVKLLQKPLFGSLMKVEKPTAMRILDILARVCAIRAGRIKMTSSPEMLQTFLDLLNSELYLDPDVLRLSVKIFGWLVCADLEIRVNTILPDSEDVFQILTTLTKLLLVTPLEALEVLEKLACTPDSADQVISCPGFAEGLGKILACRDVEPAVLSQAVRCLGTLSSFSRTRSKILSTCPGLFQSFIRVIREDCEPMVLNSAAISVAKIISDEPYFKLHDSRDLLSVVVESIELSPTKDLKISVGSHVLQFVYTLTSLEAVCERLDSLLGQIFQISTHDAVSGEHVRSVNRIIERVFPHKEVYKESQLTLAATLVKEYTTLLQVDGTASEIKREVANGLRVVSQRHGLYKVISDAGAAAFIRKHMERDPLFFISVDGIHVVEDIILQRSMVSRTSNPDLVVDILRFYMAFTGDTRNEAGVMRQELSVKAIASLAYWKEVRDLLLSDGIVRQLLSCVTKDATRTSLESIAKIIQRVCCTDGNEPQRKSLLTTALGRYVSLLSSEREVEVEEAAVASLVILGSIEECRVLISSDDKLVGLLLELLGEDASEKKLHGTAYLLSATYGEESKGATQRQMLFMDEAVKRVAMLTSDESSKRMQGIAVGGLVRLAFTEKDGEVIVGYLGAIHELLRVVRNVSVDSEDTARQISEVVVFVTKCRTEMEDLQENFMWVRRHVLQSCISIVADSNTGWVRKVAACCCLADVLLYEENRKLYTMMSDVGPALLRLIQDQESCDGTRDRFHVMKALTLVDTEVAKKMDLSAERKALNGRVSGRMMLDQYDDDVLEDLNTLIEDFPLLKTTSLLRRAFVQVNMESKDLAGALEDLNKAVSNNPTDSFSWQERGVLKSIMEDYEGALVDLNESLRIGGDDYEVLKHRAKVKFQLGDEDGAAFDAQQALCVRFRQCKPRLFYNTPRCFGVLPVTFGKFKLY